MRTSRRWTTVAASATVGALLFAACAPGGDGEDAVIDLEDTADEPAEAADDTEAPDEEPPPADDEADEIVVGFITSMTGAVAASGLGQLHGFELYLELHDNSLGGRTVDFHAEDDDGTPDQGVEAARRLVESVEVDFIVGPLLGNVGLAIGDYLEGVDTPQFYTIPASDQFLRGKPDALFMGGGTAAQSSHPLGEYIYNDLGYERAVVFCQDYAYGHELCGGAVNTFADQGGEIVERIYAPLGTADYAPFVTEMQGLDFDVVINALVGADSIVLQRTMDDFGMGDTPLLGNLNSMDQSIVREVGDSVLGRQSAGPFAEGAQNDATVQFVQAYEEQFGEIPTATAAAGYFAGEWIDAALHELGGSFTTSDEFIDALLSVEIEDSVFGPITIDEHGNIVFREVHLREVQERDDGAIWNVPIATLAEDVGPTYYYDYDAYLAQPPYTPDYVGEDWPTDCDAFVGPCPLDQ